jgi:hypothetical protein
MSWSYSGNPSSTPLDEVRFLTSDTDQTKPWTLQDEEIQYAITLYSGASPQIGDNLLAAAVCAETALGKLRGIPGRKKVGDLERDYSATFKFYQDLATTLRNRANLKGVRIYAGGISRSEKQANDSDTDRVLPAARVDGMNHLRQGDVARPDEP